MFSKTISTYINAPPERVLDVIRTDLAARFQDVHLEGPSQIRYTSAQHGTAGGPKVMDVETAETGAFSLTPQGSGTHVEYAIVRLFASNLVAKVFWALWEGRKRAKQLARYKEAAERAPAGA